MKKIYIIGFLFFLPLFVMSQDNKYSRSIRILAIQKLELYYLLHGIDINTLDTLTFISLADTSRKCKNFKKIKAKGKYIFEIADMDIVNGLPAHSIRYPYLMSFGQINIIRNGRDGKTGETTQYRSINTKGLFIERKNIIKKLNKRSNASSKSQFILKCILPANYIFAWSTNFSNCGVKVTLSS